MRRSGKLGSTSPALEVVRNDGLRYAVLSVRLRLSWVATLLVAQLTLLSPEGLRVLAPARSSCRPDCVMHTKQMRCHAAASSSSKSNVKSHCPHQTAVNAVFHPVGCSCGTGHDDTGAHGQPTLVENHQTAAVVPHRKMTPSADQLAPVQPVLEPPLRPPSTSGLA